MRRCGAGNGPSRCRPFLWAGEARGQALPRTLTLLQHGLLLNAFVAVSEPSTVPATQALVGSSPIEEAALGVMKSQGERERVIESAGLSDTGFSSPGWDWRRQSTSTPLHWPVAAGGLDGDVGRHWSEQ